MKTLESSFRFASSDAGKFRLKVLEYYQHWGWRATVEAFEIGKSTLYDWKRGFDQSEGRLSSLVPRSTRPHHVRQMTVDSRLIEMIHQLRKVYGRVGKKKLKVLLDAYAESLGIIGIGETAIGKIIQRNHYFFEGKRKYVRHLRVDRRRVRKTERQTRPGYVEMDSVIIYAGGDRHVFMTVIDVYTKQASCLRASVQTARMGISSLQRFEEMHGKIHTVQTDNGSEFLGDFDQYLREKDVEHVYIYPRCPRVNGCVERFNRTIQEEFLERCDDYLSHGEDFEGKLLSYLNWYNTKRPHAALNYLSPAQFTQQYFSEM